jgi:arsenate reductase
LPDSPTLDFILTVCDNAAKEVCPVWPGQPMTAHWGVPDPAAVRGSQTEVERAFRDAFFILDRRISLLLALPLETLDSLALQRQLDNIGQTMSPVDHK